MTLNFYNKRMYYRASLPFPSHGFVTTSALLLTYRRWRHSVRGSEGVK